MEEIGGGKTMRLKTKTIQAKTFLDGLHQAIVGHPSYRQKTKDKTEVQIQTEIRPMILRYLEEHFRLKGFKDPVQRANKAFYWEGQEGVYGRKRATTFGGRCYPDFIITEPYLIAVEFKKSPNGSVIKQGLGQSLLHTSSGDFDFVYLLFHDESKNKKIVKSLENRAERITLQKMWGDFNVYTKIV